MRPIFKICTAASWAEAQRAHRYTGSEADRQDGFIHFSTPEQVAETAAKHFRHVRDLVLVVVDAERLGPSLKWEPSRRGALFPHLYGTLDTSDVISFRNIPDGAAREHFLADISMWPLRRPRI
jgi:uncharacterized protein (DUF952 family)